MTLGNIGALVQQNVKRMLAYSSIAHAGYLLVAFAAAKDVGISAAIFYTAAYAAMNVGAFAVVSHLANVGEKYVTIEDYAGLGRRAPAQAAILTVFMLSLIGIPDHRRIPGEVLRLPGSDAVAPHRTGHHRRHQQRHRRLLLPARDRRDVHARTGERSAGAEMSAGLSLALIACVAFTIYLGVLPGRVLEYALQSARALVQ